jgi:CheY-like chemotaxis protein
MYNCKVLCILDDAAASTPVVRGLEAAGCEVFTATNTLHAAAIAFIKRDLDAVVLDTTSAESGERAARAIRSLRRDLPILLVTCAMPSDLPLHVDACVCAGDEDGIILRVLQSLAPRTAPGVVPGLTSGMRPRP